MRPSRFTDQEILAALAEVKAGTPAIQVCRRLGITQTTFYRWRRKHQRPRAPSDDRTIAQLREENRKLKEIVTTMLLEKE